jgi:hypothetical protein
MKVKNRRPSARKTADAKNAKGRRYEFNGKGKTKLPA